MKVAILLIAVLAFTASVRGENVLEIATRFDQQKIEAVQTYLDENPDAEDKEDAIAILVGAYMSVGEFKPVPDLLTQRYDLQDKGEEANLQLIIGEIARPLIDAAIVSDQRDQAKAFVSRVKSDFADSPSAGQVTAILDQFGAELYLPGVGDRMDIAFTDLDGKEIDTATMGDKVILVDFWATWCAPCVAEMPTIISAYEEYKDKGFEVIGISLDDSIEAVEKFSAAKGITWPQYCDGKGYDNELAQRFGINRLPASFLVGKGGKIIASELRGDALGEAVKKALGE
ncbi:MAG: TlpA disulfide reductase family protein [Verrucomicrobiales bacterium]|nr:TlpA disulfide reductase family protein [Verrucomicrobiales bacterium]